MQAPFYIISDNHFMMNINDSEIQRRNKIRQVFDKIKKTKNGTLIIGGDFFDFWFETKTVVPRGYEDLINALSELNQSGIEIHYLAGNHDYWDYGYLKKTANIIFHKNDLKINYNNQKILFTHGDGLLKNDYGYRFMKKIIRSKIFVKIFSMIPHNISFQFANKMSKSSSGYNHHDKYVDMIIKDVSEFAEKKWKQEFDIVMVGHYHQQKIINKNHKSLVFLGDWLKYFTVTQLDENGIWQGDWEQFLKLS